jgi:hypothetical protein
MKRYFLAILWTLVALAVCLGSWAIWGRFRGVTTGDMGTPTAEQRVVQNMLCSGLCENVTVTSEQEPGKVYLENTAYDSCIPVTLWANRMRENQVGVNGYFFDQGAQVNLRPTTLDTSAGESAVVRMAMADVVPSWYEEKSDAVFSFSLQQQDDWNLIDAASFSVENGEGIRVNTEYATGVVTMADDCSENADGLITYALYQSPELVWPGSEQAYLVSVVRRGGSGEREQEHGVKIFERIYTQAELEARSIAVEVVDGDVMLSFELVRE